MLAYVPYPKNKMYVLLKYRYPSESNLMIPKHSRTILKPIRLTIQERYLLSDGTIIYNKKMEYIWSHILLKANNKEHCDSDWDGSE